MEFPLEDAGEESIDVYENKLNSSGSIDLDG